jgi:hypothetical protein
MLDMAIESTKEHPTTETLDPFLHVRHRWYQFRPFPLCIAPILWGLPILVLSACLQATRLPNWYTDVDGDDEETPGAVFTSVGLLSLFCYISIARFITHLSRSIALANPSEELSKFVSQSSILHNLAAHEDVLTVFGIGVFVPLFIALVLSAAIVFFLIRYYRTNGNFGRGSLDRILMARWGILVCVVANFTEFLLMLDAIHR